MRTVTDARTSSRPFLVARGLRGLCDGYVAVLLPAYLQALGLGIVEIGVLSTLTLTGSAAATLAVGAWGHRVRERSLLLGAAALMIATGLAFAGLSSFWPLAAIAFVGTLNPSSGDVSLFLPIEHARIARLAHDNAARTQVFARYALVGSLCAAVGALAAALPQLAHERLGVATLDAMRAMFIAYALAGAAIALLYRRLPDEAPHAQARAAPLGPSRGIVVRLAALFSVDSFAGGLLVNALLALWLSARFGMSAAQAGTFFFAAGLLGTASQLLAPVVARRIGLLNTMVFTHIPASVFLMAAALAPTLPIALALLLARSALSQMDVPARSAYVMAVVTPAERAAAASFTAVPRSLASAAGPTLGAALLSAGLLAAPLLLCGGLKIAYDLALLRMFRGHEPD
jgi:MFS family permease